MSRTKLDIEEHFRFLLDNNAKIKIPEDKQNHLAASTKLLEKQREVARVHAALASQKEEFQIKLETLHQKQEDIKKKQNQMAENDRKRKRAEKRANEEKDHLKAKNTELERLRHEYGNLMQYRDDLCVEMQKYSKYQRFIEHVVEVSDEFDEVHETIDRHETLKSNYEYLLDIQRANDEHFSRETRAFNEYLKQKNEEKVEMNNRKSSLQNKLDACQSESQKSESKLNHIQATAASKTLDIGKIKMSIRNLYQLALRHKKIEDNLELSLETDYQLRMIQEFISDMSSIMNEISRAEGVYATPSTSS